jgi:hypothetical protein
MAAPIKGLAGGTEKLIRADAEMTPVRSRRDCDSPRGVQPWASIETDSHSRHVASLCS